MAPALICITFNAFIWTLLTWCMWAGLAGECYTTPNSNGVKIAGAFSSSFILSVIASAFALAANCIAYAYLPMAKKAANNQRPSAECEMGNDVYRDDFAAPIHTNSMAQPPAAGTNPYLDPIDPMSYPKGDDLEFDGYTGGVNPTCTPA